MDRHQRLRHGGHGDSGAARPQRHCRGDHPYPVIDPARSGRTGSPDRTRRCSSVSARPRACFPDTDLAIPVASQAKFMDLPALWKSAGRGAGVTVAVVDTGVNPSVRLPHLCGEGDYVDGGDGLTDCDTHGTVIASIIGAAPAEGDALVGVALDAELLSIRQSSGMCMPANPGGVSSRTAAPARCPRWPGHVHAPTPVPG